MRLVGVAVKDQFGAHRSEHGAELGGVGERLAPRYDAPRDRVMDQNHAAEALGARLAQQAGGGVDLDATQSALGEVQRRGRGGREVDDRHGASDPQVREVAGRAVREPRPPGGEVARGATRGERIVVSRADRHLARVAEGEQPRAGGFELLGRREIDHIAGDRHMVGRPTDHMGGDGVQHGLDVPTPLAPPGEAAQQAFRGHVAPAEGQGRRRKLQVRKMGEAEGGQAQVELSSGASFPKETGLGIRLHRFA